MNKILLGGLLAAVAVPGVIGAQVKTGGAWGPYQTGVGGEFTLTVINNSLSLSAYSSSATGFDNGAGLPSFQTFCIENSSNPAEHIYLNTTYNAVVNDNAMWGGAGVNSSGDPLSAGTGWLYSQFATGTLAGYTYSGSGRLTSADQLQQAFWWLEGESGVSNPDSNPFILAAKTYFGSEAAAKAGSAATYGVKALNLTKASDATYTQDQLYYAGVPDGGTTMMLLGLGLSGIALAYRRNRK